MKEKILEAFARLGFKLEDADGIGYVFDYEGKRFLYLYNEDDEDFMSIALPNFYDYEEDKAAVFCALSDKLNSSLKYVKVYAIGGSLWLFYERELFGGEDLEALIRSMILHLEAGLMMAARQSEEIEKSFAEGKDADEDDADSAETDETDDDA